MSDAGQPLFQYVPRQQQIEVDWSVNHLGSREQFALDDETLAIYEDRDRQLEAFLTNQFIEAVPPGLISMYWGTAAPDGWLLMDGSTVVDAESRYPRLFAVAPAGSKSGSDLILPNTKGRMIVGRDAADTSFDVLGETGGAKTKTLTLANLAAHTHTGPSHSHTSGAGSQFLNFTALGGANGLVAGGNAFPPSNTTDAGGTGATGSAGSGTAHDVMNPYIVFIFIVRAF